MKTFKILFIALILSLIPAYSYAATLGLLRVSLIDGDVQIQTEDTSDWVPAAINTPLKEGDRIWVPEAGRAEIQLRAGTYVRLDENSSLEILTAGDDSFQFYLAAGHAYVNFKGRTGGVIQMDTPVSSVRAYDRSKFRVDVADDGFTDVSVFRGVVYAESRSGKTRVTGGNALSVGEDVYAELSPLGPSDEWEKWNMNRDRLLDERRYSNRYLPDDLDYYSYDFDENGRWVNTPDYGYVWTPTVVVSAGWSPYRVGRWAWVGGDYVWISYEPWGWVPYHYGRWSFIASIGWCWVPPVRGAVYWGPGFVGWVNTPSYVAWVPLAPGEIYYGYGYYGPSSVNIINVNINNIVIKNVYRNAHVRDAVSVVDHNVFVRDKYAYEKPVQNPFLTNRINVGRPQIKPERATFMPIIKDVPKSKLPPQLVRNIRVKELKRERPLAAERKASVFRPGSAEKTMPVKKSKEPLRLEGRKFMGKETTPRKEIQPVEKQKPESRTIEKQRKTVETPPARLKEKPVTTKEKLTTPLEKSKQLEKPAKKQKPESRTIEKQRKAVETPPARLKEKPVTPPEKRVVTPKEKRTTAPLEKSRQLEQPVEKQKPESRTIERQRKVVETPPARLKEKPKTQIKPSGKKPGAETGTTELKKKVEPSVERQKGKAVESSLPRSADKKPEKERPEKEE